MRSPLWIIVRREITEKMRSRAFRVVNVVLVVLVLAVTILPGILGGGGDADPFRVAAVGDASTAVLDLATTRGEAFGVPVEVEPADDVAAGRKLLTEGDVDAVLVDGERLITTTSLGDDRRELLDTSRQIARLDGALADAGLDEAERRDVLAIPPLDVEFVGGDGEQDQGIDSAAAAVGFGTIFLLYGLLIFYGQQVAQGLVQEKQSRVIEVLLAAVRPIDLLGGKLIGLGLLGVGQIALLAASALIGIQVGGAIELPPSASSGLVLAVPWFLLGYALYATMFAMAAAVVPKVEDLQTAVTAPIVILIASLFVAQFALTDPGGLVATVGALVPFSAPIVGPLLTAVGQTTWPLTIGGVVSVLAMTAILVPITARIHAGAALSTRTRVGLRDALRRHDA